MAKKRRLLFLAIALVVVGSVITAAIVLFPASPSPATCVLGPPTGLSQDSTYLLVPCGDSMTMKPHSFVSYTMVRLSDQMTAVGQYVPAGPTNGSLGAFLLNSSELGPLLANRSPEEFPANSFWDSGPCSVCNLSVVVPGSPGQYYLVLENIGPTAISLDWPFGLVIYYRPASATGEAAAGGGWDGLSRSGPGSGESL